ncbi:hypothetical protein EXE30_11660 [Acinetobacter halotolerans]|uniref:Uncharacterized protein n=1 Tax=Acinetobacter halotolerans TaxID=1752076 RepID=A0A4Q6XFG7_9GAMM|nr:hypothetical protein [Acinetobacter halotolerans]RZF51224.1 hypothetical protein EXE30_11660 [Acinetobacter halotolerans]
MLASNVLKLRLDRIEQQGHHLSVKDQLKLVTLAQPELTAGLYSHLFHPTLPKTWHFQHGTTEEINCSLRLIALIHQVFIPAYQQHAHRFAWFEQCLVFHLQYVNQPLGQQQRDETLTQLASCKDSPLKLSILKQLHAEYDDIEIKFALAALYQRLEEWSLAIAIYKAILIPPLSHPEHIHYDFIHCLLSRNRHHNEQGNSDVVEALQHLANLEHIQQQHRHEQLTQWAVSLMLPEHLQSSPVETTKLLIDLQHRLKFVGHSLNHWLVTHEFIVPYYKNVIESAPKLLNNNELVVSLDRHKAANEALQKILTGRDLKLVRGIHPAHYSLGFIWNYLHINPLVLDALVSASKGHPDAFYNLKQIPASDYDHDAAVSRLSSYLAKQQVAYNLSQQGHSIEFAEHSHLAGFDLIVDGTPMQVKCTLASEAVESFAKKHPHIAIIVNIELAHLQEKYASVFADLALSYESVQHIAQTSLQDLGGADDFLPIPLMNTGFAVYRNFSSSQTKPVSRPYLADKQSNSVMKSSLAIGAAIGGIVSGSIGAFVIGGFAVYRTWRVQKVEQAKPMQEKQQLIAQCNLIMELLIDLGEWFNQHLLKYRVDLYAYQLRQIETKLIGKIPEAVLSTTLFSYQFEAYQRTLKLHQWMQKQLAYDNPKRRVQAGWVALAQSDQFMSIELKQRVMQLNAELIKYKQMSQHGLHLSSVAQHASNNLAKPAYPMQAMQV